jgi:hypothetical protein
MLKASLEMSVNIIIYFPRMKQEKKSINLNLKKERKKVSRVDGGRTQIEFLFPPQQEAWQDQYVLFIGRIHRKLKSMRRQSSQRGIVIAP